MNFMLFLKKYSVPTLLFILGNSLIIIGEITTQVFTFKVAGYIVLLAALVSILILSNIISNGVTKIIGLCSFVVASILLYLSSVEVSETMEYQSNYNNCKEISRRNLSDLRTAQLAYFDRYKVYASDWETIIKFIETDSIYKDDSEGEVPDRKITEAERNYLYRDNRAINDNMTVIEAYKLSKSKICPSDLKDFKRDTVKVSFIKTTFTENRGYLEERAKNKLGKFSARDLKYIPFTEKKEQWDLKTSKVLIDKDSVMTIRVEGLLPFTAIKGQKTKELFYFGKLELNDIKGSWEEK